MLELLLFLTLHEPCEVLYVYPTNRVTVFYTSRGWSAPLAVTNQFYDNVTERKVGWFTKHPYKIISVYGQRNVIK